MNYYLLQKGCSLLTYFASLLPVQVLYQVITLALTNRDRPAYQRFVFSHVHGIRNTNYDAYVSEMAIIAKDCFLFCKSTSCPGFIPSYYISVDNRDRPAYQRFVFSHAHGIRNTLTIGTVQLINALYFHMFMVSEYEL